MRSIIRSSMRFQFLVLTLVVALLTFGLVQLSRMPVDTLPEFSPPYVEIQTEALGLSAEEVEQMITVPMEQDLLAGVAWLDVIRSQSVPGLSSVLVYFEPGTDLFRARQMVAERIAQSAVGLPHVSKPPTMIQPLSSLSRFLMVGLSSKDLSLIEMSVLARWTIAPQLMGVPGVAHVAIWGNRDWQLQVLIDPEKLRDQGVTLQQVVETTGNALWVSPLTFLEASTPGTGGFIDTPNQRLTVWHVLPIKSSTDLAQVPVEGTAWRLGEVAQVVEDHQLLIGDAVANDGSSLMLVIEKLPGTNTLEVTRGVERALDKLKPGLPGIEFDTTLFRPATYLEVALDHLGRSLVLGAVGMMLLLGLFFYGWRTALISLVAMTTSLLVAVFVLYQRGATLNAMVLAGLVIALSIVIDEAVVDVGNIVFKLRQNQQAEQKQSTEQVLLDALAETRSSLLFGTLMILLTAVPIFFLGGTQGGILKPMAITYGLTILSAMAVALTVTPALSWVLFVAMQGKFTESPLIVWLQKPYEKSLRKTIHKPGFALATMIILLVAALVVVPTLQSKPLLPIFQEPYLTITLESVAGTSRIEMNRIINRISQELRGIPGVNNVGAHVGRAIFGDQIVGINSAMLWVNMNWNADYEATVSAIEEAMNHYGGLNHQVTTYSQHILLRSQQTNSSDDITLRIYGADLSTLHNEAQKLQQTMMGINGIVSSRIISPVGEPTLEIEVDLASAQKYGVKPGYVRRSAAILLSGLQVGSLFEEQKVFDVVVWGAPEIRNSVNDIRQLLIDTPGGGHVRLGEVARVRIVSSPTVIQHEQMSSYIDIGFSVQGRSANSIMSEMQNRIQTYAFPLEYHATVISNTANRDAAQKSLLVTGIIALAGIFLLLQALTRSWLLAAASFLLILATLSGGIVIAVSVNGILSLAALLGLMSVVGIAIRHTILLITHYQQIEESGTAFSPELIVQGATERFGSVLITTLTTILALLPFAIFGNIAGLEIVYPMVIIILGGLVMVAWSNLFAMPVLYLLFGAQRESDLMLQMAQQADRPAAAD